MAQDHSEFVVPHLRHARLANDNGEGESVEMKIDLARGPPTEGG